LLGVEEALAPSRKSVLHASTMLTGKYDPAPVQAWIKEARVDGIILVRHAKRDQPLLDAALAANIPVVLLAPDADSPSSYVVRSNNRDAGRLAAAHLVELGHRRIAFAGGPRSSVDSRLRLAGIHDCLSERGMALNPKDVWFGPSYAPPAGLAYAKRFLSLPKTQRPTGVILGNDPMALAFMRTLLAEGVEVPREVSIVGFDGTPDGEQCWPGLTTVAQPTQRMAAHACKALLASIESRNQHARSTEYPVELVLRQSTSPAKARSR
jgi:LacI family transcriptional regulator